MDTLIQEFFKSKKIVFFLIKPPKDSQYKIYSLQNKTQVKLIVVLDTSNQKIIVLYWSNTKNFIIDSIIFNSCSDFFTSLDSLNQEKDKKEHIPDFYYLDTILTHPILKENTFAQSLAKGLSDRKKLSDKQLMYVVGPAPTSRPTFQSVVMAKSNVLLDYVDNVLKNKKNINVQEIRSFNLKPIKGDDVTLIETLEHKYYQYPFQFFNPVQSLVFPNIETDCNIIVGANTSAGKTICAEIVMDHVLSTGKKVIYLSPLKSLTQEKFDEWKVRFPSYTIQIMTGDYALNDDQVKKMASIDIICMTSEMLDSRTRKFESEKNLWLNDVGLLICDEVHIIGTEGRGHASESGIMRFTQINKDSRVLFLSATMPNIEEFSEWLQVLNEKETKTIFCDWRPVQLQVSYVEYENIGSYFDIRDNKIAEAIDIIFGKPDEKFLVFVHDKTTGRELIKALENEGITALFHNADHTIDKRLEIENQFRIKNGGLRVLVATSTLAWGVNLPARNVIIVGVHRGIQEVDELDIIQMMGRAGRFKVDDQGFVFILVPQGGVDKWRNRISSPRAVTSYLKNIEVLAFHILSEIHTKNIYNIEGVERWFSRSLAAVQKIQMEDSDTTLVIQDLINMGMMKLHKMGNRFSITNIGIVSALMYYSPYDIYGWYKNMNQLIQNDIDDSAALAWALTDVKSNRLPYLPKSMYTHVSDIKVILQKYGITTETQELTSISSIMAAYHSLEGTEPFDPVIKSTMRSFQFDAQRMLSSLSMIDSNYARWNYNWDELALRITHGVPRKILDLIRIDGVGKSRAEKLYSLGLTDSKSVAASSVGKLQGLFSLKLATSIIDSAKKLNER